MNTLKIWLEASRPRTLLLAFASIFVGLSLSTFNGTFRPLIAILTLLTAILLQILSNLANDYGDFKHGADHNERQGPKRSVQKGTITASAMLRAMVIIAVLTVVSGISLVLLALGAKSLLWSLLFITIGGLAIWAAIGYTASNNPYGYVGLGDPMVLIFFGYVAVLGTYFLQQQSLNGSLFLPATSVGLLAVGVLNINNIRDITSDLAAGKHSIAARLGARNARLYHWILLILSILCTVLFVLQNWQSPLQLIFLLAIPLLIFNGINVWRRQEPKAIDPLLKQMSISTLVFSILFSIGHMLA